jgi:peptidoglycan/xylan/chitin deacetylase (PgdA/CDA1 family)
VKAILILLDCNSRDAMKRSATKLKISGIPIFVFHGIGSSSSAEPSSPARKYWISGEQFRDELTEMSRLGFRVLTLKDLRTLEGSTELLNKTSAITFDDGQISDYEHAFPILLGAGFSADFFVCTSRVGQKGYLTWGQMREMQSGGMRFQSHGHEHIDMSRLAQGTLLQHLTVSKSLLEDQLGTRVNCFSVPYGLVNRRVLEAACLAGYDTVCTSWNWPAQPGVGPLNRVQMLGNTSLSEFRQLLLGKPLPYLRRAARSVFLYLPKYFLLRIQPSRLGVLVAEERV